MLTLMTDGQYRIYKFSNFFDLKNLPNDEFEGSKRFEDSNIFNCSSVIASAFICHLAHRGLKPATAYLSPRWTRSWKLACHFDHCSTEAETRKEPQGRSILF